VRVLHRRQRNFDADRLHALDDLLRDSTVNLTPPNEILTARSLKAPRQA
jgi:hypothetical protein